MGKSVQRIHNEKFFLKKIKELGCEIKYYYDNYSHNSFRYFEYKGQRINIDTSNNFCAPAFYWNYPETEKLFNEILPKINSGAEKIYKEYYDMGDFLGEELIMKWGEKKEGIEWCDFLHEFDYKVK